ncbi:MAG: hypothetical protein AAFR04_09975 [Pseudomonadota bacterium]
MAAETKLAPRPPQYIVFSFDGGKSHDMWRRSLAFADKITREGKPLRFTYFVSAVYFVTRKNRKLYDAPGRGRGRSAIGWASSDKGDIAARMAYMRAARNGGHEIASHAVGHFDGKTWSAADWASEFRQFDALLARAQRMTGAGGTTRADREFANGGLVGFRAPQLGTSPGLWKQMKRFGMRYDSSRVGKRGNWPKRTAQGFWNFPLAVLPLAGSSRRTLSMDYNFYVSQSKGEPNPALSGYYERQTFTTYVNYFKHNFYGNRAPMHVANHFSLWNNGAYWRAMKRFARMVCGLEEVRCVTYRELASILDAQPRGRLAAWQRGAFRRKGPMLLVRAPRDVVTVREVKVASLDGADGSTLPQIKPPRAETGVAQPPKPPTRRRRAARPERQKPAVTQPTRTTKKRSAPPRAPRVKTVRARPTPRPRTSPRPRRRSFSQRFMQRYRSGFNDGN